VRPSHRRLAAIAALVLLVALPGFASANHSWGNYHWARVANPFTLKVGDNVSSQWDSVLDTTISDWTQSTVLNLTKVAGQGAFKRKCNPTVGRVEVCNNTYGNNGWLGVAQIWASGSHITQGTVRLNDTYFNTATYNTTAWRNLVSCQEVGHTLGLDHQDENFNNANLGTCMDYTSNPGTNQHPNAHDYAQLVSIYSHLDSTTTVGAAAPTAAGAGAWHADFGLEVARSADGRTSTFVRELGAGQRIVTHVIWA
jgi:hypothetical protein